LDSGECVDRQEGEDRIEKGGMAAAL
jgi:hypothetical protein